MGTGGLLLFRRLRGTVREIYLKARFHCDGARDQVQVLGSPTVD